MRYAAYMSTTIKVYTRLEVAELLGISLSTVGNLIKEKSIYHVRVGGTAIRVPHWAVADYLAGRPAYSPDNPLAERDGELEPTDSFFNGARDE